VDNVEIEYARYGLYLYGPTAPTVEDTQIFFSSDYGIYASGVSGANSVDILATWIIGDGTGYGVYTTGSHVYIRSSYITHTDYGIYTYTTANHNAYLINNTIVYQNYGIYYRIASSSADYLYMYIYNNVIANNNNYAIYAYGSYSHYYDYVEYNNFFDTATTYGSFNTNVGNLTSDPLIEDDDWDEYPRWWDGKLWGESLARNGGGYGGSDLPTRDILGNARNLDGLVDMGAFEFDITANVEPRADSVEASIMAPTGEVFQFDGSTAYDPDGIISVAFWTMSDGTVTGGQVADHTFITAGSGQWGYITVIDNDGAEDHAKVDVNVNTRPIANAGPSVYADVDEDVFFDGTLSSDPDGTVVAWDWDYGDGTPHSSLSSPVYAYASSGNYIVTLVVTDNEGLTHMDTTDATIYGTVDTTGPLIVHTEVADGQPLGVPVVISANIQDTSGVQYAFLWYRDIGAGGGTFAAMVNTSGDIWEATIPGAAVTAVGVEYWIEAADNQTIPISSLAPPGAPGAGVFDFLVTGDPDPPVITHTEITDGQSPGVAVTVNADITDVTGVGSATLYYRPMGGTTYGSTSMVNIVADTWSAQIPAFMVAAPGVEYYIEAIDTSPVPNTGVDPAGAPTSFYDFTVTSGDTTDPIITHTPIPNGQPENVAVSVTADFADSGGVASGMIYYRDAGSAAAWDTVAMTYVGGITWSGDIPGVDVTTTGVEYYISATDNSSNTATDPSSAPATFHSFTVSTVDTAGPSISHTPILDGQPVGVAVTILGRSLLHQGRGLRVQCQLLTRRGARCLAYFHDVGSRHGSSGHQPYAHHRRPDLRYRGAGERQHHGRERTLRRYSVLSPDRRRPVDKRRNGKLHRGYMGRQHPGNRGHHSRS
jgi:PKD repeat protein